MELAPGTKWGPGTTDKTADTAITFGSGQFVNSLRKIDVYIIANK